MRTKISEFSATPGDNTDIDGIDIAEGCAPSGINNAIRELMAQLKDMQTGASGDTFTLTTVNSTTVDTTNLEATNLKAKDGTAAGSIANSTGVVTLASSVLTTTDINGGTVDGTVIGGASAAAVSATNLAYTGTLTGGTGVVNLGSGQFYKDASGNVGIGTSSPGEKLDVVGAIRSTISGKTAQFNATGGSIYGEFADGTSTWRIGNGIISAGLFSLYNTTTATQAFNVTTSGNVGIGTSSPAVRLDVGYVAGSVALRVSRDASNRLDFYQGGGVSYIDSSPASAQLAFATVGSERMRIDSSGSVSITQAPGQYTIDTTNGAASIANGGTVNFSNASGMLLVNSHTSGDITIYLCAGGSTSVVSALTTQVGTFAYNAGITGYTWTNNSGSSAILGFMFFRTRTTA